MSDRSKMLLRLWRATILVQAGLAICGVVWFGTSPVELVIVSSLLVCLTAGQLLRIAYNRSVRSDPKSLPAPHR